MSQLNADNVNTRVNQSGEIVIEPGYVEYLREHGFTIEAIYETHTVASESSDGAHIVANVETYELPKDHPELDVVEDTLNLWVCDCWSYRQSTTDVGEGDYPPDGTCKHIRQVSKVEAAKQDDSQETL